MTYTLFRELVRQREEDVSGSGGGGGGRGGGGGGFVDYAEGVELVGDSLNCGFR